MICHVRRLDPTKYYDLILRTYNISGGGKEKRPVRNFAIYKKITKYLIMPLYIHWLKKFVQCVMFAKRKLDIISQGSHIRYMYKSRHVSRDPVYMKTLNGPTLHGAKFHTAKRKWLSQSLDWSWLVSLWIELIASHLIVFELKRERCEQALQNLQTCLILSCC